MARIPGAKGALYVGIATSAAVPSPVAFLNDLSFSRKTDKYNVTSFEDDNKTVVTGKDDFSGTYGGFYDTATAQLMTAASDGDPRNFYLYPDRTVGTAGKYWYGQCYFDQEIKIPAEGPATINGAFSAAGNISQQG